MLYEVEKELSAAVDLDGLLERILRRAAELLHAEAGSIALLTTKSAGGSQYSLRAANAAACVAEYSPDSFFDFHEALFRDQPEEGSEGLTDEQLVQRASKAGVTNLSKVTTCIEKRRFTSWVQQATVRALNGPIPDAASCPDDASSDVALSAVGQAETENAGRYDQVAEQLKALQDWVRQQQAVDHGGD